MGTAFNPYEPPKVDGQSSARTVPGRLVASRGARFANLVVDSGCRFIIWLTLGYFGGDDGGKPRMWVIALSLLWMVGYYFVFEALFRVTPGKLVTSTRVVDLDGNKPTVFPIFVRSLARFVPFEPLSFFGRSAEWWHDRWSDTRVVRRA